ncbi:MAG TPA: LamG domain-containing protein [Phycisphaerales bacterium]|jgi:hypothetical protein|nr:LamG domain-containing protein [Phycisphaerales bacterium]
MNGLARTIAGAVGLAACVGTAHGAVGTILLVVVNSGSLTAQESAKKALMEGWGYTVTPISASASSGTFNTSCQSASCAYISCTVSSVTLSTKLQSQTIPVIVELDAQATTMGFASSQTNMTASAIDISTTSHYITSTFSTGSLTLFTSNQAMRYLSGTLGSFTTLGKRSSNTNPALAVFERADSLSGGSSTATGRRVYLPWSGSTVDITALTSSGQTMMQRSIEWCLLPVSCWKLDDGSGSTATDTYAGHSGTVSGATWQTGKLSKALKFNGTSNYVSIANDVDFQITRAVTVTAWVKATSSWPTGSTVATLLRKGDDNPNNWELCIANGKVELNLDCGDADGSGCDGGTTVTTNVWHHVAGTWDGTTMKVYLDGALDGSKANSATIGTDTRSVYLGGRVGSTDVTPGLVDDVRFFNRALTAAEIAALARASPTLTSWENVAP